MRAVSWTLAQTCIPLWHTWRTVWCVVVSLCVDGLCCTALVPLHGKAGECRTPLGQVSSVKTQLAQSARLPAQAPAVHVPALSSMHLPSALVRMLSMMAAGTYLRASFRDQRLLGVAHCHSLPTNTYGMHNTNF